MVSFNPVILNRNSQPFPGSESRLGRPGAKSAVNPVLYDICKFVRMPDASRVIEGEGGGIREAITALTSAGLRPPRFIDTGSSSPPDVVMEGAQGVRSTRYRRSEKP
ncbi:MAG: ATP-binding protein [Microlunatus sp.]